MDGGGSITVRCTMGRDQISADIFSAKTGQDIWDRNRTRNQDNLNSSFKNGHDSSFIP